MGFATIASGVHHNHEAFSVRDIDRDRIGPEDCERSIGGWIPVRGPLGAPGIKKRGPKGARPNFPTSTPPGGCGGL